MDPQTRALRIGGALLVVASLVAMGLFSRSPWMIALVAPPMVVLYALGKWHSWRLLWAQRGAGAFAASALIALPIQAALAGILYLVGLNLSRLLFGPLSISVLTSADVLAVGIVFLLALAASLAIIRIEGRSSSVPAFERDEAPPMSSSDSFAFDGRDAPRIDPAPLTRDTFFRSPGHWVADPLEEAMEGRGRVVDKRSRGADEARIAAAEERLSIRLPSTLRALYRIMDGGHVGELYVPATAEPLPHNDWRGAFSIDYSSLVPLNELRTVDDHYRDFTEDPDEIPPGASRLVILQARYGDMTLLDYNHGPEPRILLVDFDGNGDLKDVSFDGFDGFFAALRRPAPEARRFNRMAFRTEPLTALPQDERPAAFWADAPHRFANIAASSDDGAAPRSQADDALVAEAEERLGHALPEALRDLYRHRNGGAVAYGYLDRPDAADDTHGRDGEVHLLEALAPLEYLVTLGQLSDRVRFPDGERSWRERVEGADDLLVLQASRASTILLDYRAPGDPIVIRALDVAEKGLDDARSYGTFDELPARLRAFKPLRFDD